MIPEDIKQLLHEIRLIGGGIEKYDAPDDWRLIQNIMDERHITMEQVASVDWAATKQILLEEKRRAQEKMDEFYRDAIW